MGPLPREVILTKKNLFPISFGASLKGKNLHLHAGKALSSKETNQKLQKLFPVLKMAEKHGNVLVHLMSLCLKSHLLLVCSCLPFFSFFNPIALRMDGVLAILSAILFISVIVFSLPLSLFLDQSHIINVLMICL